MVLSVLLHVLLGILLLLIPAPENTRRQASGGRKHRAVQVLRTAARKKADQLRQAARSTPEEKKPTQEAPFAKTNAETPQARPDQPEYEGKRDTRAASAPDARHLVSEAQAPAMSGEKKEELVTFDQDKQEGDLNHEGKQNPAPPTAPPAPPLAQETSIPTPPPAAGQENGSPTAPPTGADSMENVLDATKSLTLTDDLSGQLKLQSADAPQPTLEPEQHAARKGTPQGTGAAPTPPAAARRPVFYDPSLADHRQQPGFRTRESRSRSSGQFVLGRGAALNVAATPRGQYEAMIYRRVAHFWYMACDEHRGDIIPGKITISLRINRRGQIDSMALIKRSGASISQQSFTFKAIRKATLPPMPAEVQEAVIGELMELIFEFNFD